MDIVLVLLRLLHLVSAFVWFGLSAALALYIAPAALAAGENGMRFLKSLLVQTAVARVFPIASGLTMLAGILLYIVGNSASHFSSTGNIVLGIGALAGIVAGIHGGAVTGRSTQTLGAALAQRVPEGGAIPADALPSLRQMTEKLTSDARLSFVLMAIALIGMGSARYL
jgi:hypothetical protein